MLISPFSPGRPALDSAAPHSCWNRSHRRHAATVSQRATAAGMLMRKLSVQCSLLRRYERVMLHLPAHLNRPAGTLGVFNCQQNPAECILEDRYSRMSLLSVHISVALHSRALSARSCNGQPFTGCPTAAAQLSVLAFPPPPPPPPGATARPTLPTAKPTKQPTTKPTTKPTKVCIRTAA